MKSLRRNMTAAGLKPKWLLERVSNRDGRLAAHADRLGRLSTELARTVEDYKGPLTRKQLATYLDNAFRGMNLRTGASALDEKQIARIGGKRGLAADTVASEAARTVPETEAGLASAPEFIPIIRKMRVAQDALSRDLRRAGLLDAAAEDQLSRTFGLYAHRQYESVRNPKWKKRVEKEPLWNRAFELTAKKWETDANRQRAEAVAKQLKLAKPPEKGPVRAGDRVLRARKPGDPGQRAGRAIGFNEAGDKIIVAYSRESFEEVAPDEVKKAKGTREDAARDVHHWLRGYTSLSSLAASYGVPEATIQDAYDKAVIEIPSKTKGEILGIMDKYLQKTGSQVAMPGGMPEGAKDLSVLRRRGDQDSLERALKGEVKNIQSSFMTSSLKMATLLEQQRFLEDIAKEGAGKIFHREPVRVGDESYSIPVDPDKLLASKETAKGEEPGIDELAIQKGKGRTGPLSGTFTSQDIIDELTDVFDDKNYPAPLRAWMTASFFAKGAQTIGSLQSGNRNFLSNFAYILGHGVNPANVKRFRTSGARAYGRIFQHLYGKKSRLAEAALRRVFGTKPDAQTAVEVQRRLELGLYDQGTDVGDLKRLEKRSLLFRNETPGAGSAAGKIVKTAGNWYQSHDNYSKDYVLEALVPQYEDALGVSRKEAEEHVAGHLRDSMQNYSRVPRLPRAVASMPFLPGPFLSFSSEVIRNNKNLIQWIAEELKSDNPKLRALGRKKLVGLTTAYTIPIAAAYAARYWLGLDDDDDEAVRKFMAPWNRNSQIMFLQKEPDDITFIDLGFMDAFALLKEPLLRLWNGDPEGAIESLGRPLSEDLVTQKLIDIARNTTESGGDVYNERETLPYRTLEKAQHLGESFEPGTSRSIRRIADPERKTGYEILALLGPRITTINIPKELTRRSKQYKIDTGNDLWIEKEVVVKKGTEAKRERAAKRSERRLRESVEWIMSHVAAARQLDIDEDKIEASLADGGLGAWEVEYVMDGDVDAIIEHYKENVAAWEEERDEE